MNLLTCLLWHDVGRCRTRATSRVALIFTSQSRTALALSRCKSLQVAHVSHSEGHSRQLVASLCGHHLGCTFSPDIRARGNIINLHLLARVLTLRFISSLQRPCTRVFCATMKGAARKCVRESKIFRSPFANVNYSSACKLSRARLHKHQTPGRAVDQQWTLVCVRHRYPSSQKHALPQCASSGLQLHECHSKACKPYLRAQYLATERLAGLL